MISKFLTYWIPKILLGIFLGIAQFSFCQDTVNEENTWFYIQPKFHFGQPIKYSDRLTTTLEHKYYSADFRLGYQSKGSHPAEYFLHFPSYGVGFYTSKLSNPDTLGYPFATYLFYQSPFIDTRYLDLFWEFDFGLAWHFNQYDSIRNPQNDLIGSDLNIIFNFNLGASFKLSERFDVNAGFVFTHFSNGTVKLPNKGLNQYGFSVGTNYHFAKNHMQKFKRFDPSMISKPLKFNRRNEWITSFGIGTKAVGNNSHYLVSEIITDYFRAYQWYGKFGAGLDFIYDRTLAHDFDNNNMPPETKFTFIGYHISHELTVTRLSLVTQIGGYLHKEIEAKGDFFFRLSLRYYLNDRFFTNMSLKTVPTLRADFIEFGGGVKIF